MQVLCACAWESANLADGGGAGQATCPRACGNAGRPISLRVLLWQVQMVLLGLQPVHLSLLKPCCVLSQTSTC